MYVRPFTLFSTVHPALLLFYALGAPVLAMFGNNPVTMGVMFLCAVSVHWFYLGGASTKDGLKGILFVVIFVSVLNMLSNPMGVTELFKIGSRLFTGKHVLWIDERTYAGNGNFMVPMLYCNCAQ